MTERLLTARVLNRALLERQLLLRRATLSIPEALERVAGLQTQYAPSGYVGLWTRLVEFKRDALTAALRERSIVQATLMRTTIHLVSAREFWCFAIGVRRARREWWLRVQRGSVSQSEAEAAAARLGEALRDGPRTVKELGPEASGFLGIQGLWVDIVRVPPSGTWERRRADRLALAESWLGPSDVSEEDGLEHLVRAYLRGYGPATWADIASWAGVGIEELKRGAGRLELARYRGEHGRELIDLADAMLPDADTPAPVRFLPHWDACLLVHARRAGILPEAWRSRVFSSRNPFSVGTFLVDGVVAGAWSVRNGRVEIDPFEPLASSVRDEVDAELEGLRAFHAGDDPS